MHVVVLVAVKFSHYTHLSKFPIANLVQTPLFSSMGKSRLVWQGSTVKTTVQEINDPVSLTGFFSTTSPIPYWYFLWSFSFTMNI